MCTSVHTFLSMCKHLYMNTSIGKRFNSFLRGFLCQSIGIDICSIYVHRNILYVFIYIFLLSTCFFDFSIGIAILSINVLFGFFFIHCHSFVFFLVFPFGYILSIFNILLFFSSCFLHSLYFPTFFYLFLSNSFIFFFFFLLC